MNNRIFALMNKLAVLLVFSFILLNGISQNILLSTDFQQGIPSAYSIVNNDNFTPDASMTDFLGQNAWIVLPDPENPSDTVAAATSFFETADSADRWLITPPLALASFGNYLSWNAKSHDPSFPDDYIVLVSTTDNQLASFTDTIGNIEQENFEWTNREVNLSTSGYNDSTIYIAFVLRTFDGFKLYLDDIQVRSEDPVGINETAALDLVVYPNPTTGSVYVSTDAIVEKIEVFSVNGQLLKTEFQSEISLANLNTGSYLLQITTSKGITSRRVAKVD